MQYTKDNTQLNVQYILDGVGLHSYDLQFLRHEPIENNQQID